MKKRKLGGSLARLMAVTTTAIVMATGVTYAVFRSNQVALQGNTISSATAHLLLSTDGNSYNDTVPGFNFTDIQPGGDPLPQPGRDLYIRNDGTAPLMLNAAVANNVFNPSDARLDHIYLVLTPDGEPATKMSLASLYDAYASGRTVALATGVSAGSTQHYTLQVQMESDVVTSTANSISLSNINLFFVGGAANS